MANSLVVKVDGLDDVVAQLRKVDADVSGALEAICTAGAEAIGDVLEATAPGSIGNDIAVETTSKTKRNVRVDVGPGKKAFYARFLEYGTSGHTVTARNAKAVKTYGAAAGEYFKSVEVGGVSARPFMRPAFDGHSDDAQSEMRKKAKQVVETR